MVDDHIMLVFKDNWMTLSKKNDKFTTCMFPC